MAASGSEFSNKVTADGSSGFKAEKGRYHLYASYPCPFAARALIGRKLKGLDDVIPVTYLDPVKVTYWEFTDRLPECELDPLNSCKTLKEVYQISQPGYESRVSVPVLFDKKTNKIVNNDSGEILHMFATEFNKLGGNKEQCDLDLYPAHLKDKIDEINGWVARYINGGVYKAGQAKQQSIYDEAIKDLFEHLDKAEEILSKQRYITGSQLTEADVRLFATLVRFDMTYHGLFLCNKKRIVDYPNLWGYVRDIYQQDGVSDTVKPYHIMHGYWQGFKHVHPSGIVSAGPDLDFNEPHTRHTMS